MSEDPKQFEFFQNEPIPDGTSLVGWSALAQMYDLRVPVRELSCVSERHIKGNRRSHEKWQVFDKRYKPTDTLAGHLEFAFKHEAIDLLVLKKVFEKVTPEGVAAIVQHSPTGAFSRRVWFFYEKLMNRTLDIGDAGKISAVDALDPELYFTTEGRLSTRHRVYDNLLGHRDFCPIVRRTEKLESFIGLDLEAMAKKIVGKVSGQLLSRAASFLLLADSQASFAIEGERPPLDRLERWGRAILEAGKRPLNQTEIIRLHDILIGESRFTKRGYRDEGVFLGDRTHENQPLPEFIGARESDVLMLMTGLNEFNNRLRGSEIDAVIQAACLAFGFVYIHPFTDGNGRLHRCLIHHVLAERGFTPTGVVFPVSSVMLDRIDDYRETLRSHSAPLMNAIDWRPLPNGNVEVTNDTADLYRYFDATANAEFLYECVQRTVDKDLPQEIDYLKRHDQAISKIMNAIEMPDRLAENLIAYIRQNDGKLGKNKRAKEFSELTDQEVEAIEGFVREAFDDDES